jgi:hypothetical protein
LSGVTAIVAAGMASYWTFFARSLARAQARPMWSGVSRPSGVGAATRGLTWRQAMSLARDEITEHGIAGYASTAWASRRWGWRAAYARETPGPAPD